MIETSQAAPTTDATSCEHCERHIASGTPRTSTVLCPAYRITDPVGAPVAG